MEKYIVFDIETASLDFDSFSESQQEYLIRGAVTDEEIEQKKFMLGLYPFTAQVVCIGLQLMEGYNGKYEIKNEAAFSTLPDYNDEEGKEIKLESGKQCLLYTERGLLDQFWKIITKYNDATLISFNGRSFDVPFLMLRSALLQIRPSRNLMNGTKWNYPGHIDLIDELSFYNPSPYSASKRFNFDFYTRAFGITSPKSAGIDGSMVSELYNNGEIATISDYCLRDINATWELFLVWQKYLKF
ncbi:3'-5' exonuclease [bacterium]|nr:MAG: 3'-5' exonuclease [bacterium]